MNGENPRPTIRELQLLEPNTLNFPEIGRRCALPLSRRKTLVPALKRLAEASGAIHNFNRFLSAPGPPANPTPTLNPSPAATWGDCPP